MKIYTKLFATLCTFGIFVQAQIPSFGGCPDHPAVKDFKKDKFLGTWYEVERYFTVSEVGAKCVQVTYEKRPDGKIYINNAFTNRFTGVQRIITGQMKGGKPNEGQYNVRYQSLPVSYDTVLKVLDTDYDSFAIIYSCSGVGPIGHTESIWVMARERTPEGPVLQKIYGVLDRLKISRTFFIETDQKDCETLSPPEEAIDPTEPPTKAPAKKKGQTGSVKSDVIAESPVPIVEPVVAVKTVPEPISHVSGSKSSIREQIAEKIEAGTAPVEISPAVRSTVVEKKVETVTMESESPALRTAVEEKVKAVVPAVEKNVEPVVTPVVKIVEPVVAAVKKTAEKKTVVPAVEKKIDPVVTVVEEKKIESVVPIVEKIAVADPALPTVREVSKPISHVAAIKSGVTRESTKTETTNVASDKTERQIPVQIIS